MKTRATSSRTIGLLVVAGVIVLIAALPRFTLTYDLGFFLPPPETDAQRLLIERLGQGPGTQLIFAVLPEATQAMAENTAIKLRSLKGIERVLPEAFTPNIEAIPKPLWQNRLLLADLPQSVAGWQEVLEERLMDTMVADDKLLDMIAADPALTSIRALERVSSTTTAPLFEGPDARYLLIQTEGSAFDLDIQQEIIPAIRNTLKETGQRAATLYGSGVYGVDLRSSVTREAVLFSALASFALALVVYLRFRNLRTVLAVGVPLFVGAAAGIAALALLFEKVHGITLAFGFTLLGVAIDYPLHVFSNAKGNLSEQDSIWPTLGLGISSTLIAYLAFVVSPTPGMQQLGVFALAGIGFAALAAFLLSPTTELLAVSSNSTSIPQARGSLRPWLWLLFLVASVIALHDRPLFSNNLSEMTPVPKATLARDAELRKAMGVADIRYLISVRRDTLQSTLEGLEEVEHLLDEAADAGRLSGFQSAAAIVPSNKKQLSRRSEMIELLENKNFEQAITESEFEPEAFAPFIEKLRLSAEYDDSRDSESGFLSRDQLLRQNPELEPLISTLIYPVRKDRPGTNVSDNWVGLVFLSGLSTNTPQTELDQSFQKALAPVSGAEYVDLKQASQTLVSNYRERVFKLLTGALLAIACLLLVATRNPRRVLWLLGTIAAALSASLVAGVYLLDGLSLFDVIALALVAGLGLDYALFFSRDHQTSQAYISTQRAVALCALSSLLVFGILGFSSVPLLRSLGITVASGVTVAYLLSRFGRNA